MEENNMSLFGKKKEKSEQPACCCSGARESTKAKPVSAAGKLSIKVLGAGCKSCHKQYENVQEAVADLGIDANVEYITDMEKVMNYGVMSMPAVIVNEQIVSVGRVLKASEVGKLLQ